MTLTSLFTGCQTDGHEVLIRKVYSVPLFNSPLFSIRTHWRRGAGSSIVADDSGCWLTLPSFIMKIDDFDDFLLPIAPSDPTAPLEYSKPLSIRHTLTAARRAATTKTISCRRSRVPTAASHLLPVQSPEKRAELPIIPTNYVPESASAKQHCHSSYDLHRHFGCRKLNYDILPHLGTGLHVTQTKEPPLTIGDMSMMKRGARGGPVTRPPRALHTVGIDIGYRDGKSPGGYQYFLFMADLATRYSWTYGLADLSGDTIIDALWRFFVDAGGFPRRLCCDFDRRFLAGSVSRLLWSHGVRIGASPPHRQSQNGAVERNWNTAVEMARSFLAEAGLPRRYWFWAVREATVRMNMLPVKTGPSLDDEGAFQAIPSEDAEQATYAAVASRGHTLTFGRFAGAIVPAERPTPSHKQSRRRSLAERTASLSTPLELFHGIRPDYRILYKFGSVGYFRRTIESTGAKKSKFSDQSHAGIALGRSDYTNGMMFWDPTTSRFSVSLDYSLDPTSSLKLGWQNQVRAYHVSAK
jgi:transposase InsO family protein